MRVIIDGMEYAPVVKYGGVKQPLPDVLKHARDASGQTLEQVAAAVGTSKGHLCGIENGKGEPRFSLVMRLLQHYHVSADRIDVAEVEL